VLELNRKLLKTQSISYQTSEVSCCNQQTPFCSDKLSLS
jgi:hypothetical protein